MKLEKINEFISLRKTAGTFYNEVLKENENITIVDNDESSFNYYSIVVNNGSRDELQAYLYENEVSTSVYYPKTLPSLPAHNIKESFPNAEYLSKKIISLPIFPSINQSQQSYVVEKINDYFLSI